MACSAFKTDSDNPRKAIAGQSRAALRASLSRFGMVDPILVSVARDNLVVGGHQRLDVWWRDLGHQEAPFLDVGPLSDIEIRALNIALNKISSEWDYDKLSKTLRDMRTNNPALLDTTGYGAGDLARLIGKPEDTRRALQDFMTEPDPGKAWLVIQGSPGGVAAAKLAITKAEIKGVRIESFTEGDK